MDSAVAEPRGQRISGAPREAKKASQGGEKGGEMRAQYWTGAGAEEGAQVAK